MNLLLLLTLLVVATGFTIWAMRQPARRIARHPYLWLLAWKGDARIDTAQGVEVCWELHPSCLLIGEGAADWSRVALLGSARQSDAPATLSGADDIYLASLSSEPPPVLASAILRLKYLLGFGRSAPLSDAPLQRSQGRQDLLPDEVGVQWMRAQSGTGPYAFLNLFQYVDVVLSDDGAQREPRAEYLRYGIEAFKALYATGAQIGLMASITRVLRSAHDGPFADAEGRGWDGIGVVIYPDSASLLRMEQRPAYRAALRYRDTSLRNTVLMPCRVLLAPDH